MLMNSIVHEACVCVCVCVCVLCNPSWLQASQCKNFVEKKVQEKQQETAKISTQ